MESPYHSFQINDNYPELLNLESNETYEDISSIFEDENHKSLYSWIEDSGLKCNERGGYRFRSNSLGSPDLQFSSNNRR